MATDSENQAELDAARERQNEKQRAFRASFRSVDESTKITVTDLGKQEIPRLPQIHGNGNPFKRNLNYIDLLSSPTVASHREACSGAGRITGHQDLRTAERRGWVILEEPILQEEIPLEYSTVDKLTNEIRNGSLTTNVQQSQTTGDVSEPQSEANAAIMDRLWEFAAIAENSNLGISEGEERRRIVSHYRWERNSGAARAAKERAKYQCEVCGEEMAIKYGADIGANYAEAHHKIPLSEINDKDVVTSADDLVCVCANCHRMLHRLIRDGVDDALGQLKTRVHQAKAAGIWANG